MLPDLLGRLDAEVSEDSGPSCRPSWAFSGPRVSNATRHNASLVAPQGPFGPHHRVMPPPTLATEFQTAEPPENSGLFRLTTRSETHNREIAGSKPAGPTSLDTHLIVITAIT